MSDDYGCPMCEKPVMGRTALLSHLEFGHAIDDPEAYLAELEGPELTGRAARRAERKAAKDRARAEKEDERARRDAEKEAERAQRLEGKEAARVEREAEEAEAVTAPVSDTEDDAGSREPADPRANPLPVGSTVDPVTRTADARTGGTVPPRTDAPALTPSPILPPSVVPDDVAPPPEGLDAVETSPAQPSPAQPRPTEPVTEHAGASPSTQDQPDIDAEADADADGGPTGDEQQSRRRFRRRGSEPSDVDEPADEPETAGSSGQPEQRDRRDREESVVSLEDLSVFYPTDAKQLEEELARNQPPPDEDARAERTRRIRLSVGVIVLGVLAVLASQLISGSGDSAPPVEQIDSTDFRQPFAIASRLEGCQRVGGDAAYEVVVEFSGARDITFDGVFYEDRTGDGERTFTHLATPGVNGYLDEVVVHDPDGLAHAVPLQPPMFLPAC